MGNTEYELETMIPLSPKNDPERFAAKVREIQLENGWEE